LKSRGFTVGSLRGQPQASVPVRAKVAYTPIARPMEAKARRCCGSGCADCPIGRRIRARAGLPTV